VNPLEELRRNLCAGECHCIMIVGVRGWRPRPGLTFT
jgi:hypothetical protein